MGIGKAFDKIQSIFTGMPGKDIGSLTKLGIAVPAVGFGAQFANNTVIDPMRKAISNDPDLYRNMIEDSSRRRESKRESLQMQVEFEEQQRRMAQASMRLEAIDPHLYNEVMAGRRLPKDAVVFGGQPRTDLMEQLAMGMSQGQFTETNAQDELMKSLGV